MECGLLLVESYVFSVKVLPKLRGLLKTLSVDADEASYNKAQALLSRIDGIENRS